jgi:hypothetical protein
MLKDKDGTFRNLASLWVPLVSEMTRGGGTRVQVLRSVEAGKQAPAKVLFIPFKGAGIEGPALRSPGKHFHRQQPPINIVVDRRYEPFPNQIGRDPL